MVLFQYKNNTYIKHNYISCISLRRRMALRTVTAAEVLGAQAPPATVFLHDLHFQIPTAERFIASLPQNLHVYLACWLTSIFLAIFLRDAPYRVPYLPTIPTFFVRFAIFFLSCGGKILNISDYM